MIELPPCAGTGPEATNLDVYLTYGYLTRRRENP